MAKKKKTLPKNFGELIKTKDITALKAVFDVCELDARGGLLQEGRFTTAVLPPLWFRMPNGTTSMTRCGPRNLLGHCFNQQSIDLFRQHRKILRYRLPKHSKVYIFIIVDDTVSHATKLFPRQRWISFPCL